MPAEDRARKPGAPASAPQEMPPETGVSMRALLASCAAADAVSRPPSDAEERAGAAAECGKFVKPGDDEGSAAVPGRARTHQGRDAA
jgi:hypothetical protein